MERAKALCARADIVCKHAPSVRAFRVRETVAASRVLSPRGAKRLMHDLESVSRDVEMLRAKIESAKPATRTLRLRRRSSARDLRVGSGEPRSGMAGWSEPPNQRWRSDRRSPEIRTSDSRFGHRPRAERLMNSIGEAAVDANSHVSPSVPFSVSAMGRCVPSFRINRSGWPPLFNDSRT